VHAANVAAKPIPANNPSVCILIELSMWLGFAQAPKPPALSA
jgi:hypothetical protein